LGAVSVHGGGSPFDTVTYYDFLNPHRQTYSMTATQITDVTNPGFAAVTFDNKVHYAGLFTSLQGSNTVNLLATAAATYSTGVQAEASDTVNVGSDPVNLSHSILDPIQGPVTVNSQGSNAALNVYDQGTSTFQNWDVANTGIDRYPAGGTRPAVPQITYYNLARVTVNTGSGGGNIGVVSTAAGTTTVVNGNAGGSDEFSVENSANRLDDIQGPVQLNDVRPSFLQIVDGGNTVGHTYTVTTGEVQRDIIHPITITYGNMGEVVLATADNPSGHSTNTVNVNSLGNVFAVVAVGTSDMVTVGQNSSMANILGDVRIQSVLGQVPLQVTLDASADPARTVTLSGGDPTFGYLVSGLLPPSTVGRGRIGLLLDPATPVTIKTGMGNDIFSVHDLTGAPALTLDGGGGTNTLDYSAYTGDVMVDLPKAYATGFSSVQNIQNVNGSIGNDLIVGSGSANAVLKGGTRRNVLIGRGGGATLDARSSLGDNILIGGTTDWDMNLAALQAIMAEWDRTDLGFNDRRSDLLGNGNSLGLRPLNVVGTQQILLTPATNPTSTNGTVHGDTTRETLLGSLTAPNWFFVDDNGLDTDNFLPQRGDKRNKVR
jgi:hypothetical protein